MHTPKRQRTDAASNMREPANDGASAGVDMAGRRRLLLLSAALFGLTTLGGVPAGVLRAASDPTGFLKDLGDRAVAMLSDPDLSKEAREENFRQLMREGFDLRAIARFILGRYWRQADEEQRAEFIEVFQRVMAARFAPYFSGTSKDTFQIMGPAPGSSPDSPTVRSKIQLRDGKLAEVDWRLKQDGDGFRIVDVVTEGVSMGITLRSEYGSVLSRSHGDIGPLIERLREKVGDASS